MENKIILIEDDEEIRSMVKDYLSGEFQVLPFSEGKTAIHTVKNYDEYSLALRLAQHKLPIKTRIIKKEDLDTEIGGE